jgi:hypothetical protein
MTTFFSVLILFSFMALFIYLMYQIVGKTLGSSPSSAAPSFDDVPSPAAAAEFNKVRSSQGSSVRSIASNSILNQVSLRDVVIKSSYNTAFTGSYMNLDMIKQVLSRGCRVLDFQIFVKNGSVVVGYSNATFDPSFTSMTSVNCLSLAGVCSTIMSYGFSDASPNKDDPLFVQFHLKTDLTSNYDTVARTLYGNFKERLAWNQDAGIALQVTPSTLLSDLKNKLVILMDAPQLQTYSPTCTQPKETGCHSLAQVVNMQTALPTTTPIYSEAELSKQMYAALSSTPYLFRIVQPSLGFFATVNPDATHLIRTYGAQVVMEAFYILDSNLKSYEKIFDDKQCAFLLLSDTIGAITRAQAI